MVLRKRPVAARRVVIMAGLPELMERPYRPAPEPKLEPPFICGSGSLTMR
jgi:hypothetical protein